MAQNSKDAQKRTSRAERRAAEAAEMKARAEQMEKERKHQTIIGGIVVAVLVILVAIGAFTVYHNMHKKAETKASTETVQEAYTALQKVKNTPKLVDKKGGLLISKNGYGKAVEGAPTSTWISCARAAATCTASWTPTCRRWSMPARSIWTCISWRSWTVGPPTSIPVARRTRPSTWPSMTATRTI